MRVWPLRVLVGDWESATNVVVVVRSLCQRVVAERNCSSLCSLQLM